MDFNAFDLKRLSECYTHIICIHSFCLNIEKRKELKAYVADMVGLCSKGTHCLCIKQHSTRNESDETEEKKEDKSDILHDVLLSCLNSLHCYLLHDKQHLYRIRRGDINSNLRFTSVMDSNPLEFHDCDEIDELIHFLLHQTNTVQLVENFIEWIKENEYDWDALLRDIGCNTTKRVFTPNQSNIHSFFKTQNQQALFAILNDKYVQQSVVA
eukprot:261481_1